MCGGLEAFIGGRGWIQPGSDLVALFFQPVAFPSVGLGPRGLLLLDPPPDRRNGLLRTPLSGDPVTGMQQTTGVPPSWAIRGWLGKSVAGPGNQATSGNAGLTQKNSFTPVCPPHFFGIPTGAVMEIRGGGAAFSVMPFAPGPLGAW